MSSLANNPVIAGKEMSPILIMEGNGEVLCILEPAGVPWDAERLKQVDVVLSIHQTRNAVAFIDGEKLAGGEE